MIDSDLMPGVTWLVMKVCAVDEILSSEVAAEGVLT